MVEACPGRRADPSLQGGAANPPGEGQEELLSPTVAISEVVYRLHLGTAASPPYSRGNGHHSLELAPSPQLRVTLGAGSTVSKASGSGNR